MRWRRNRSEADNFDLLITKVSDRQYRARVQDPHGDGIASWDFSDPFTEEIQQARLETAGGCRDLSPTRASSPDTAREIGSLLFKTVFGGTVLAFWKLSLLKAQKEGRGLRVRLHLGSPELWDWPWELLCDSSGDFLAVNPATPVVRYIEMAASAPPLRVRPPLRVLAVTASPSGLSPVGVDEELEDLEKSLAPLEPLEWVELSILRHATKETLLRTLKEGDFHILHFIGHGAFDTGREQGVIFLEKPDGSKDPVDGLQLHSLLQAQPRVRLVVLNACNGSRGSQDPFASLAQSLVKARLPAVIAMQSSVTDRAAITFARHFYESLAKRQPVDRAVSEARHAMLFLDSGEWGNPVLAMRAPEGRIFDLTVWEELIEKIWRFLVHWRKVLVALLLLFLLGTGLWELGKRMFDRNLLYSYLNPPECPSPPGLDIAFAKIEPPGSSTFCMSRFEVTQHLWKKVMGKVPTRRLGGALPVVRVSWNDANDFLAKLGKRDPRGGFRLPTGREWVSAARAGTQSFLVSSAETANCNNKDANDGYEETAPVGSFLDNAWGLYDMAGNVSEWVSDLDESGTERVRRGGSFENVLRNCSFTYFTSSKPDAKYRDTGIRIVRNPILPK